MASGNSDLLPLSAAKQDIDTNATHDIAKIEPTAVVRTAVGKS